MFNNLHLLVSVFLSALITGCATKPAIEYYPEIAARHAPAVELGNEITLFDKPVLLSSSLISKDGRVHFFIVDESKKLTHLELNNNKVEKSEVLGKLEGYLENMPIDAIEEPKGKLRVLVADRQYVSDEPNRTWKEIKGNRCVRFVSVGSNLFCGFVSEGKELHSPKRKDVTVGLFILLPVVYWSNEQAAKLVLAQESNETWAIRAVVDPDTIYDANQDFLLETDSKGILHALYYSTRGGGAWAVLAGATSMGGGFIGAPTELHHANFSTEQLLSDVNQPTASVKNQEGSKLNWLTIQGNKLPDLPFLKLHCYLQLSSFPIGSVGPLAKSFSVNPLTGDIGGISRIVRKYDGFWEECNAQQW